jgi:hypothetical protein
LPRISKDFQIVFSPQGRDISGNYVLELTPRRATAAIGKLFIVVHRDAVFSYVRNGRRIPASLGASPQQEWAFPILSTTMADHQGNTTTIEFSNVRPNVLLNEGLFTFVVSPDLQVVKPPRGQ